MLWAVRVTAYGKDAKPHTILELKPDATLEDAQKAFHEIARIAHPDLHRSTLSPEDLETVTSAYARAAGAYQDIRSQRMSTARLQKTPSGGQPRMTFEPTPSAGSPKMPTDKVPTQQGLARLPTDKVPTAKDGIARIDPGAAAAPRAPGTGAASQMSSKALIYYRKAELSLRRGDLKGAVLQIKMAIAADPQSSFLRTALAEVEAELAKTT
jgi:hypothetical protein